MDENGYPEESELEEIRTMDVIDWRSCIEKIQALWIWDDMVYTKVEPNLDDDKEETKLYISTGGWSGHEDVMMALQENRMFWALYWESSHRGGHYVFTMRDVK